MARHSSRSPVQPTSPNRESRIPVVERPSSSLLIQNALPLCDESAVCPRIVCVPPRNHRRCIGTLPTVLPPESVSAASALRKSPRDNVTSIAARPYDESCLLYTSDAADE